MKNKSNLYFYLARLDKKGIKVLTSFVYNQKVYPTRVKNIKDLHMRPDIMNRIAKETYDNRMRYELFAESADSFNDLKDSLRKRGYTELPMSQFTGYTDATSINILAMITDDSSMTRRGSRTKQ